MTIPITNAPSTALFTLHSWQKDTAIIISISACSVIMLHMVRTYMETIKFRPVMNVKDSLSKPCGII